MDDLLDRMPCGFVSFADDGTVMLANATLAAMVGRAPEELLGRQFALLLPPGGRLFFQTHLFPLLKLHGRVDEIALALRLADGGNMPALLAGVRHERDGRIVNDCVVMPMRIRTRYEQELLQAKRAAEEAAQARERADRAMLEMQKLESLGVLAGGIAHDFNNLLAAILGNADLALMELPAAHLARPSLAQIQASGRRAADLTAQMLAYSGRGRLAVGPLDLAALVRETNLLLRASTLPSVRLELELGAGLPPVEADAAQLRQLLLNLVINAAEAVGDRPGAVTVSVGLREVDRAYLASCYLAPALAPGPYVALEVADDGAGMDEATRARIFEPFFSTKFAGRGLGLAAALGIVRGHGGAVRVVSSVGWGSTVTVLLPPLPARPPARAPSSAEGAPALLGGATVLVIDDEPPVRAVTARMLGRMGYAVLEAAGGQEGLDLLEERPEIVCVLLDLTMPGLSGEETLRRIRARFGSLAVVIASGYSAGEVRDRLGEPAPVLQKPFSLADLRRVLGELAPLASPA